jgi:hypothetical protein
MLADKIVSSSKAEFNRSLFLAVSGMPVFLPLQQILWVNPGANRSEAAGAS